MTETPTAGQTAMTLITAAADPSNAGDALSALLDATLQRDLDEQGDPLAQVEHLILVTAKLAAAAALLAQVVATGGGTREGRVEDVLMTLSQTSLMTSGQG